MKTFWLSFVGDAGFLGVCIVDAETSQAAVDRAKDLGIHPGGDTHSYAVAKSDPLRAACEKLGRDRLISQDELEALGAKQLDEHVGQDVVYLEATDA